MKNKIVFIGEGGVPTKCVLTDINGSTYTGFLEKSNMFSLRDNDIIKVFGLIQRVGDSVEGQNLVAVVTVTAVASIKPSEA